MYKQLIGSLDHDICYMYKIVIIHPFWLIWQLPLTKLHCPSITHNRQQCDWNWLQQLPVSIPMLLGAIQIRRHDDTDEKQTNVWLTPLFTFLKVPCIQDNNETKIGQNSPLWAWELRRHDDTDEKQTNVWLTPLCQIKSPACLHTSCHNF